MRNNDVSRLLREIAAEAVPGDRDPWPLVRARIPTGPGSSHRSPSITLAPRPAHIVGAIALLLLIGLTVSAPVTRATVRSLGVSLLRPGNTQPSAGPTAVPASPPVVARSNGPQWPGEPLAVTKAQQHVAFPISLPAWLPDGVDVEHAYLIQRTAATGQQATEVDVVAYPRSGSGWLGIHQIRGQLERPYGLDADHVQKVSVAGQPAIYAHGTWNGRDSPTASPSGWDPQADANLLTWERGGVTYVLRAVGLRLSLEDAIRIAESLH